MEKDQHRKQRKQEMKQKIQDRRAKHTERSWMLRVLWVGAGVLVTIAGILMLIFPGPAFVVIPAGLAMLALEFAWAEKPLLVALEQADKAKEKASGMSRRTVFLILGIVLILISVLVLSYQEGWIPQNVLDLVPVIDLEQK